MKIKMGRGTDITTYTETMCVSTVLNGSLPVVEDSKADGIHVTTNVLARIHVTAHEERYVVERCG
jgi:hypothetical protein